MGVTGGGTSADEGVAALEDEACLCCALRVIRTFALAVLALDTGALGTEGGLVTELE